MTRERLEVLAKEWLRDQRTQLATRYHGDSLTSLLERVAEEAVRQTRVQCKCGKDTASISNALCYTCRNQPYWDLESAKAEQREADAKLAESSGYHLHLEGLHDCPIAKAIREAK